MCTLLLDLRNFAAVIYLITTFSCDVAVARCQYGSLIWRCVRLIEHGTRTGSPRCVSAKKVTEKCTPIPRMAFQMCLALRCFLRPYFRLVIMEALFSIFSFCTLPSLHPNLLHLYPNAPTGDVVALFFRLWENDVPGFVRHTFCSRWWTIVSIFDQIW